MSSSSVNFDSIEFEGEFIPNDKTKDKIVRIIRNQIVKNLSPETLYTSELTDVVGKFSPYQYTQLIRNTIDVVIESFHKDPSNKSRTDRESVQKLEVVSKLLEL